MDDLISRQAAIEALCVVCSLTSDYHKCEGYQEGSTWCDEVTALRALPSAQPERKWIPVTKKAHPDLPIRVQVQMDNGWIITAYYQEGEWLSVPDCGEPLLDNWIEAWRELPEPWRGEDHD